METAILSILDNIWMFEKFVRRVSPKKAQAINFATEITIYFIT